eukprot:5850069-Pyramimonas_sp.AAC.3
MQPGRSDESCVYSSKLQLEQLSLDCPRKHVTPGQRARDAIRIQTPLSAPVQVIDADGRWDRAVN